MAADVEKGLVSSAKRRRVNMILRTCCHAMGRLPRFLPRFEGKYHVRGIHRGVVRTYDIYPRYQRVRVQRSTRRRRHAGKKIIDY